MRTESEVSVVDHRHATAILILAAGIAFAGVFLARAAGVLQFAELLLYDVTTRVIADDVAQPDVATVQITDTDLQNWGWPVPDKAIAGLIDRLSDAGAKAIGIDLYREQPLQPDDKTLERAFAQSGAIAIYKLASTEGASISAPAFLEGTDRSGFSDVLVDPDGVSRRALILVSDSVGLRESLALRLARAALRMDALQASKQDPSALAFGNRPVPPIAGGFGGYKSIDDSGYQIMIQFPGRASLPTVTAGEVLSGSFDTGAFKDRVAIIGTASEAVKDSFRTPVGGGGGVPTIYGMELHAAVVQQLLDYATGRSRPISSLSPAMQALLLLSAALLGGICAIRAQSFAAAILLGPGAAILSAIALSAALDRDIWLPAAPFALTWLLSFTLAYLLFAATAWQQQRKTVQLFSDFVSPELFQEIWKNREMILSGGRPRPQKLFATIMFADLAGSTAIGGNAEPAEYMAWLDRCLECLGEVAQQSGGFLEKYTGDGIMVGFGVPIARETESEHRSDAIAACNCAIAIQDAIGALNRSPGPLGPYRVRIGIHSGLVFGGTLGGRKALRYNLIGDTSNVAARAEAFGKRLGPEAAGSGPVTICLTEVTERLAVQAVLTEPVGVLRHEGGQTEYRMFRLLGMGQHDAS